MLKPTVLRMLLRLMRTHQVTGPLLTLGVQDVLLTYSEAEQLLRQEGIEPNSVPEWERLTTTSVLVGNQPPERRWTHARTFFRLCGIPDYNDLDASACEGPTLVHDLNQPVPTQWHGKFGWVLDSGTTEHVFDVRSTLSNLVRLTRVGGHVAHVSPMTGWANHGFYQLSPCLFHDFYRENGFAPLASYIAHPLTPEGGGGLHFHLYNYTPERIVLSSPAPTLFIFLARKMVELPEIRLPIQTKYKPRMVA